MSGYSTITDRAAERERLILEHLPQVRLIAYRMHERLPANISLDDLISTGIVGLMAAIDNYDPSQQTKLRTYAECKIRSAILDSLRDLDWVPRERRRKAKQVQRAVYAAMQRQKRTATEDEIAAEMKLSLDEYHKLLVEIEGIGPQHLEYQSQDGSNFLKFVAESGEPSPAALFERAELEALIAEAIGCMPEKERTILSLYYREELTLREIGQILGIHLVRVSQLKTQAILRLRSQIEARWFLPSGEPNTDEVKPSSLQTSRKNLKPFAPKEKRHGQRNAVVA